MSFTILNYDEFPALDASNSIDNRKTKKSKINGHPETSRPSNLNALLEKQICESGEVLTARVGISYPYYSENFEYLLQANHVGEEADFILIPICIKDVNGYRVVPDLALSDELWRTSVAVDLGTIRTKEFDIDSVKQFEQIFAHALYLQSPIIVVDCPNHEGARLGLASIINNRLAQLKNSSRLLIRVKLLDVDREEPEATCCKASQTTDQDPSSANNDDSFWDKSSSLNEVKNLSWNNWNSLRSHLIPDSRIGVCLYVNCDIENFAGLRRWEGEPVRMMVFTSDQFTKSPTGSLRLTQQTVLFTENVVKANSLATALVIDSQPAEDYLIHLKYLRYLSENIIMKTNLPLRPWNDVMMPPLQPLSSNLDSGTYSVFERDSAKYRGYEEAMELALKKTISKPHSREITLMVLGAGRGPLVDCFIRAIKNLNSKRPYRIFALDKNPSSVASLRYKQSNNWKDETGLIETEVIQSDMRDWTTDVKADIIASELLGSLSDNELSPECLDGVWRLATPETISIPQEYQSYVAPISSYRLHQDLHRNTDNMSNVFDSLYVVRLTNFYQIDQAKRLFSFNHKDLSQDPKTKNNERYARLNFRARQDTVCHGFAGYFSTKLFASVRLSTLYEQKTAGMESWFPAFLPIETPIYLAEGTEIEVHFWRKESSTSVWYEWTLTKPVRTRMFSPAGRGTTMSKFT